MSKPRLTAKTVEGLRKIASLALADLQSGALNPDDGWPKGADYGTGEALKYIDALCDWYEIKHPTQSNHEST